MHKSLLNKHSNRGMAHIGLIIVLILGISLSLAVILYQKSQKAKVSNIETSAVSIAPTEFNWDCNSLDIEFDNPQDIYSSDKVKLICILGSEREIALEIDDMYTSHYHSHELVGGNVYLIRRIDYDGYPDDDWADELWVYFKDGKSTRIASSQGLDFRVSSSGNYVVVDQHTNKFLVINTISNTQHEVDITEYLADTLNEPDIVGVTDNFVWLEERFVGPYVSAFYEITLPSNAVKRYSLPEEISGFNQYSLNLDRGLVAYTNYPALFEEYAAREFEESNTQITLSVYDLKTKTTTFVAKGTKTKFSIKWINDTILEYTNPNGEGILQKTF